MNKSKNVPKIRFEGFSGEWENRKVCDIANRFDNLRIPVAANLRVPGSTPYYGANGIQDYVEGYTHEGEFVLVAEDGANDLKNYPVKHVKGRIWVNNHAHVLQAKVNIADNQFLKFCIIKSDVESLLVGGGRSKLNAETMMDITLMIPSIEEQRLIGDYIAKLEDLITFHQQKYEKLLNLKKSLLYKLFPKESETVPELRFEGFSEKWKEEKIERIGKVSMCRRIFKEQTSEVGDIPFYKIGTFGGKADAFISKELFMKYKIKYPYPKNGDILISASGSIGKFVEFINKDEYFQDSNIVWINHDESQVLNTYLKNYYLVIKWNGLEGSTIKRLYNTNINKTFIKFPMIAEQTLIGQYFSKLDKLIELNKEKLEKLKNVKESLLDKMFV